MKFSECWLREFVDPEISTETLTEQLTMAGLEVESVEPAAPEFSGVVVAQVKTVEAHPDAEKLSVCGVSDGTADWQVVCGAPNVRPGLMTAFARVGARLPENFKIRTARLRGVESQGMLCSAAELGLGEDADGILELPSDLTPGEDLRQALALEDVCIDLDLTPNRGDCLSVTGVAREVGVLNDAAVHYPAAEPVAPVTDERFPVELADSTGCPRYLGRVIKGIDIERPTPLWMREKLRRSGLRSIDPTVDITNYVLLELGQPMHAFDLNRLSGGIVVRRATPGEQLTLLDGQDVTLDPEVLLIADASGPVAMAGVMGGERSGIQADTRDVFLECAYFNPLSIAGVARRYGLQTDASHRYERGVDYTLQQRAIERATALMIDIVGGEPGPVVESVDADALPQAREVQLRQGRLDRMLGESIPAEEVDRIFQRLDLTVTARSRSDEEGVVWCVAVPSHRFDIEREADLVEEVCRIHGYNRIDSSQPLTRLELAAVPIDDLPPRRLKYLLADLGYQEIVSYSFIDPRSQHLLDPERTPVEVTNPMSQEHSVMRTRLLPGLLKALHGNINRQQSRVRLFELGRCFVPNGELQQPWMLGGLIWGEREPEAWTGAGRGAQSGVDFYDLKGDVERLLQLGGHSVDFEPGSDPALHPGQSASVSCAGEAIGVLGRLHPEVEQSLDLRGPVFCFELLAAPVLHQSRLRHEEISRYPSVRRDLSLRVASSVSAAEIRRVAGAAGGDLLVNFTLFDVYHGEGIDSNEKSVAVGLTFQHPSRTLTESEIGDCVDKVVQALETDLGARLR